MKLSERYKRNLDIAADLSRQVGSFLSHRPRHQSVEDVRYQRNNFDLMTHNNIRENSSDEGSLEQHLSRIPDGKNSTMLNSLEKAAVEAENYQSIKPDSYQFDKYF